MQRATLHLIPKQAGKPTPAECGLPSHACCWASGSGPQVRAEPAAAFT